MQSVLKVLDNSGAKIAKCIKVLGGFKKKQAKLGDLVVVSIKKTKSKLKKNLKVNKKEIYKALVIETRKKYYYKDGSCVIFSSNGIVLINKQNNIIGTRVAVFLPYHFNYKKYNKLISISSGLK